MEALRETARKLPATIYRVKGVIDSSDAPTRRAVLQAVGKLVEVFLKEESRGRRSRTQIVVIGAAGSIDVALLRDRLETSLSSKEQ